MDYSRSTASSDFYRLLTEAVAEFAEYGFTSMERVDYWSQRIREAAFAALVPQPVLEAELRSALTTAYRREVDLGHILKRHKGVSPFTLDKIKPRLRPELDRRIMASASQIKLNRTEAVETTIRRWQGWATSIPPGGSDAVGRVETKQKIRKSLAALPFEERRVAIDQAHKLVSDISDIIANDNGAIAGEWESNFRQRGYDYREEHKERDRKVYLIRGTWAVQRRLVKAGPAGFMDEITRPGEEVSCGCRYRYFYDLDQLPANMLTAAGLAALRK